MPDRMPERMAEYLPESKRICQNVCQKRGQIKCQIECQSICQKECQIESRNKYVIIFIYIYIYTSRWYVRNYVRIVFQCGDHSKKVIWGDGSIANMPVSIQYLDALGLYVKAFRMLLTCRWQSILHHLKCWRHMACDHSTAWSPQRKTHTKASMKQ